MLGGLTLGGDGAGDFPARRGCHRPRSSGILYPKRLGRLPPLDGDARTCTTEPEETKHPILQRRRLVAERPSVRGWQDLRAVHDSRGPCSEKGPFLARSSRGVFPNGCLRGISDAWRAYLAKASPFSDAWRANLAANWRFSRPRPLSGCMGRKTCHGLPPGDAPRRNLATARPPRTHRARILPLPVRPRAHQGAILPPSDAGKRISRAFCHRRAPGNAYSQRLANRAASSCGRAYCLAIALVPYESDDLFVQAVLCT